MFCSRPSKLKDKTKLLIASEETNITDDDYDDDGCLPFCSSGLLLCGAHFLKMSIISRPVLPLCCRKA